MLQRYIYIFPLSYCILCYQINRVKIVFILLIFQLAEITFRSIVDPSTTTRGDSSKKAEMQRAAFDTNVYDFGILLLEIISGKLPHSGEQGNLVNWVSFTTMIYDLVLNVVSAKHRNMKNCKSKLT